MQQEQQQIPATYRSLLSAVDVITEQALERQMNQLRGVEMRRHEQAETPLGGDCLMCEVMGLQAQEAPEAEPTPIEKKK